MKKFVMPLIVTCVMSLWCSFAVGDELFDANRHYQVFPEPDGSVIADLNGDDYGDIAVVNNNIDSILFMFGNGDGTFQEPVYLSLDGYTFDDLLAEDLDDDGDVDLFLYYGQDVFILTNDGNGNFGSLVPVAFAGSICASGAVFADIDQDGDPDLVFANDYLYFDSLSVLFNDGDGNFGFQANYLLGRNPLFSNAVDLNDDSYPDLIGSYYPDTFAVYYNNGDGTFGTATRYDAGSALSKMYASDYDGDGDVDIAIMDRGDGFNGFINLFSNTGGDFIQMASLTVETWPEEFLSEDLNDDGVPDFVVAGDSVEVLISNGSGDVAASYSYFVGKEPYYGALGDLNDDGSPDIVMGTKPLNQYSDRGMVSVLINKGDGDFICAPRYGDFPYLQSLTTADLDGDHDIDIAVTDRNSDSLTIALNDGSGVVLETVSCVTGQEPWRVVAADIDNDNDNDLIVGFWGESYISVFKNNGNGTFTAPVNLTAQVRPVSIVAADLDGDTDVDLVAANQGSGSISIFFNDGTGSFAAAVNVGTGAGVYDFTGADADGDGDFDLVIPDRSNQRILLLWNAGDGTFPATTSLTSEYYLYAAAAADFDYDGDIDIAAVSDLSDTLVVFRNLDNAGFDPQETYPVGYFPARVMAGDFDFDGSMDLAVINKENYNVAVLMGTGGCEFADPVFYGVGDQPLEGAVADMDGDGDLDIVIGNYYSRSVSMLFNLYYLSTDITESETGGNLPQHFLLAQNYPNPFNPMTTISYSLPERSEVSIVVVNLLGQTVKTFELGVQTAGEHRVEWNGYSDANQPVASGMYFYRLQAGQLADSRKMLLLK